MKKCVNNCVVLLDMCQHGEVRLQDGTAPWNGRVEVCMDGKWGSVCSDMWDDRDAEVACRQLGYFKKGKSSFTYTCFVLNCLAILLLFTFVVIT